MKSNSQLAGARRILQFDKHAAHLLNLFVIPENVLVAQQVSKPKLARLDLGFLAGMEWPILGAKLLRRKPSRKRPCCPCSTLNPTLVKSDHRACASPAVTRPPRHWRL